ncbi:hypothetical protein [Algoriphagus zhangzhouensis]|uniref:Uncharacterized protein n=1 Tax=Algoriphagus zhangzhouensis TaxID=1073327 RepID=A0A1M7ZF53_9BACT|nr:hypothetical protein [Algoriphagus zhangzhouensis]TDY46189.1 hypothetical protein A8938_2800 [Algoriphagus zhangzhouensis]SHO63504.1 hypothetical protein SAMN04488108_2797 [Algoriphagus zhangzhouensis]
MKNLPQHTPKSTSWDKILQQQDFDTQLEKVSLDLPHFEPSSKAWEGIVSELDSEKRIIPIWQKLAAAMVLVFMIALLWVLLEKDQDPTFETDLLTQIQDISIPIPVEKPILEGKESFVEMGKPSTTATETKPFESKQELAEVSIPNISLPTMEIPQVSLDPSYNPNQFTASSKNKSLHEVDISWGKGRSKMRVKTAFGKSQEELQPDRKSHTATSKTIQIKFKN